MTLLIMTYYLRSSWFIYIATNIMDLHFTVHSTVLHWTSPLQATCMHNLLCSNIFAEHLLRVNLLVRTKTANCSMCNCSVFESIMSYSCSHARRLSDFVLEQTCVAFIIPVVLLQSTISFLVSEWCWWFYQAHSTWSKFQFTGWCVLDKLKCNVLQFTRYNILPTGQTLNLSCYDLWI